MKTRRLAIQTALAVAAVPLARAGQDHTHPGALVEIEAAKREALMRAFTASGRTEAEFAEMYGMDLEEVKRTLG